MKNKCSSQKKCVVKRHGHIEIFDGKKVYASCYAAALNSHHPGEHAEKIALDVMKKVTRWAQSRRSMSSADIRNQVLKSINDEDVMLMYRHHRDIS